ncbi:MAG: D-glycero-beta-D-manno-heptose-7-phosphate kinase [Candidatus Margulisbacteria bacterium]|nr:D-glycero-beta-D-manno-heptose-7-phosphate kinase [Candidatus Margulisiibacteriota bacterium]MBU1617059.1 D-glycero-beta-D-manno-heptose-7-phosphate kinase [Candidatus Margulisiibacteriota bacterium]MBU1867012.1 D-glycero-beta-D-manno-heptose-7-phosphate kinase [Candidatus Margulisiibacteriota bacterium]
MDNLKKYIPGFTGKKILIVGDLMLDEHIWSSVSRISPEAPVPIADVKKTTHVPGGCGNVAANIAALGATPYLVGLIGRDSSGEKLLNALKKIGISTNYIISDDIRPTILKSRIIAASQHVVRVDREDKSILSPLLTQQIIKRLKELIPRVDAVIISDYEKGLVTKTICQAAIKFARANKKAVAVDPKGADYAKYAGVTIITPNLREATVASGIDIKDDATLLAAGKAIIKKAKSRFALITRGRDGMTLFDNKDAKTFPAVPREVFDITGAGDAVIATIALTLAAGASMKEATLLSNFAGSVVVGKIGTAPCFREELEEALAGHEPITRKIKSRQEIAPIARNLKNEGLKVVFTNGCFDLLHLGHVRYLREAKKLGDVLIVGVNSDKSVAALKGPSRPYVSEMERAEILASLECVDYVIIFSDLRPDNLIKAVSPNVHVKGGDYKINDLPEKKIVESLGGKVVVIPPIKGRSTTNIVAKILGGKK